MLARQRRASGAWRRGNTVVVMLALAMPVAAQSREEPAPGEVRFNRDVRPILSDHCFQCHGPDAKKRQTDLRFDTRAGAFADLGGYHAIIAGKPEESPMYQRITADDPDERMPPADADRKLSAREIAIIGRWIEQGAEWENHWSFVPASRPPLPKIHNRRWSRNAIDTFVLGRLEQEHLAPAPEADRTTLIRRLTLDLTGLPPTPAEVDAFRADSSPDAYDRVVDRLLDSPRFGERMAARWLDAARYADTSGYQNDGPRTMWRWRDWVVNAFNGNMPFDRFTVEQIAGDMLPDATLDQLIATGFNRNHRGNSEGGIIPEEYQVEYVVDRVETTSTVWLGLTLGCSRCHEHKYDPFSQQEFYQIYAYFNNVPEYGRAIKEGNSPPFIKAPTPVQQTALASLDADVQRAERQFRKLRPLLEKSQEKWEKTNLTAQDDWTFTEGLVAHFDLDGNVRNRACEQVPAKTRDGEPHYRPGKLNDAAEFDGRCFLDAGNVGDYGYLDEFSISAWINPGNAKGGTIVSRMTDAERADGYYVELVDGKLHVNLVKRWLDDAIRVESTETLAPEQWHHIVVTYDGTRRADGIRLYLDGQRTSPKVNLDAINQSFANKQPLRIGAGGGPNSRFRGLIDDVRVYQGVLTAEQASWIALSDTISEIVAVSPRERMPAQSGKLRAFFLQQQAPERVVKAHRRVQDLRAKREELIDSFPTTMVMQESPVPRQTHVLLRGQYDKPGETVQPGVPRSLPALPKYAPNDRLGFARWLVDSSNPLTARVTINRFWQMYFGIGLVKTSEDFGSQGERPSHPMLLDWLATEFIDSGWDVKRIQRLIVTSATYRQSSRVTEQLDRLDPENRLLARGPRFRLPAETVRDQALVASGLLVERIGGPSVKPYQPAGLWKEIASGGAYVQDHGANLYRRSLYTYWKRTVAPPSMINFDAAGREMCSVRPSRTNTPLQALNLMNDPTYVEAARSLAERAMHEGGQTPKQRLTHIFRLLTARSPSREEIEVLVDGQTDQVAHFRAHAAAATNLISVGETTPDPSLDPAELAAYTTTASLILNLDEVVTKE